MRSTLLLALLLLVPSTACRRAPERPAGPDAGLSARYPGGARVVAIGDLHGDLEATRAALRLAGAIGPDDRWTGGALVVVQTGDQTDRGADERAVLDLLERLAVEARAAGGALHVLNGNHEALNVQGDYRYATPGQLAAFDDLAAAPRAASHAPEQRGRAAAFLPGGEYAARFARRDTVAVVGDSVFVHGGLLPHHLDYGLDRMNQEVRDWMAGKSAQVPARVVSDRDSPLWTRRYGHPNVDEAACADLARTLERLQVKRLVVGHTIQDGGISSACGGKVWRIDVALSKALEKPGRKIQVLQIAGEAVRALE